MMVFLVRGSVVGVVLFRLVFVGVFLKGIGGLGLRRRWIMLIGSGSGSGLYRSGNSNMLWFYIDDVFGLKIILIVVFVMSFCFIGFVICFYVVGKLYNY